MDEERAALISTLGTEPQILTLALARLLEQNIPIVEVVGIYPKTTDSAINSGIQRLRDAWHKLPFVEHVKLSLSCIQIKDIYSEEDLKIVYREIQQWVNTFKARGWSIFLNVSGGRKPIALCALLVAQFLFGRQDHLLYLVSSPSLVRSREFVADPSEYRLIELPVPLWSEEGSVLTAIARYDDPWAASVIQREFLHRDIKHKWMYFLDGMLTPAERRVVEELVLRGGTNTEIASRIHRSPRTVGHQLSATFRKLREFLELPPEMPVGRTTVVSVLSPYIREDGLYKIGNTPDAIGNPDQYDQGMRR